MAAVPDKNAPRLPEIPRLVFNGLLFGAAGFALNWFKLEFYFNVDFIFGSIITMFALMRFGLVTGVTAAFVAATCSWHHWHHPWAVVIFTAEAVTTGLLRIKKERDPVLNNVAYWFTLGIGLVLLLYGMVMGFPLQSALVMGLKQGINGIFNTLVASALYIACSFFRRRDENLPSLRQLIFVSIALLVTFASLLFLFVDLKRVLARELAAHQEATVRIANAAHTGAVSWFNNSRGIIRFLAATNSPLPAHAQRDLEAMRGAITDFTRLGMVDSRSITTAFSPALDDTGHSTIGLDLSDRPYLKKVSAAPHPVVTELFLGRIGTPSPRLIIAAPVMTGGKYRGAAFGVADLASLKALMQKLVYEHSANVTLLDERGLVVISTKASLRVMQPFSLPQEGVSKPAARGIRHWIPSPKPGVSPYKRWIASLYLMELPLDGHPGWRLVVEASLKPVLATLTQKATVLLVWVGLFLLVLLFLSRFIAGKMTAIITDFEQVTRRLPEQVAAGTTITWPAPSTIELKQLIDNVHDMTRALQESDGKLKRLNAALEQRVEERTAELSMQKQRLANYILGTKIGTWDWNVQTGETDYSERWAEIIGYSAAELNPAGIRAWSDHTHPEDLEACDALLERHFRGEADNVEMECRMKHKDGRWVWVLNHAKVVSWTENGEPLMVSGTHQDISYRKSMEEALRASRELLQAIIDSTPDPISVKNSDGRYLMMNRAGREFLRKDVVGLDDETLFPPEEARVIAYYDRQVFETGTIVNFEQTRRNFRGDKRVFHAVKGPIRDAEGKITSIFTMSRDITLLHEAQEELRRRLALQERLKIIADTAPGVLFEYQQEPDGKGRFPYVSASVADLLGIGADQVKEDASRVLALIHPDDRDVFTRTMSEPGKTGATVGNEFRLLSPRGELWLKLSAAATLDGMGEVVWCGFITDVTAAKKAELVLRESEEKLKRAVADRTEDLRRLAERIEKVSEQERAALAQEIHDELGQLLAALMMDVAWFNKRIPEGDAKFAEKLAAMNELLNMTIHCARRITRDLRPRILDELGLIAAIEEQLDIYRTRHIDCSLTVPNREEIDLERANSLFRIFQESMTNVLRHSGATKAEILLEIARDKIVLEIADNGRGITAEQCLNLKSLGLLGIRERAFRWGGTADINGSPGKGTVIHVEMPIERRGRKR